MPKNSMSNFKKIVWLASYPKSGNTWIRAFVSAYLMKEKEFDLDKLIPFSDVNEKIWTQYCPINITTLTVEDFAAFKPAIIMQMINDEAKQNKLLVKTHDANVDVLRHFLIPALFTLGAIYVIRDPRDIVNSLAHHCGISVPQAAEKLLNKKSALALNKKEHELHQIITSWNVHVTSWTCKTIFHVQLVRYEDMIYNPNVTFRMIADYLGIEYDEKSFKKAMKETNFDSLQLKEKKHGFTEKGKEDNFFRKGKAGSWQTELPKHLVYKVEEQCHALMEAYGYRLSRPFGKYRYEKAEETFKGHEHRKFTNERN